MIGVHTIRTVACYWFQDMYGILGPPVKARGSTWLTVSFITKIGARDLCLIQD